MKKIVIVLNKNMENGQKTNCSAILMGQLALCNREIYDEEPIVDSKGNLHASIKSNVIILETKANKIQCLPTELNGIEYLIFTDVGQMYKNNYSGYKRDIESGKDYQINGIAMYGDEMAVNNVTRKFSLCK